MSDTLASFIYDSVEADNKPRILEQWHCSSIAECPRAQYFKRLKFKTLRRPTGAKILRWEAGHKIEEVVRPHLQKHYPHLKSNVRYTSKELDLTGEYDNYSEENKTLIEVKSVIGHAFRKRYSGDTRYHLRDEQPYLSHLYQNHAYVLLLREQGLPVEQITFLYVTLDGLICSYTVSVDGDIISAVKKRLDVLKTALETNQPPDCLCYAEHPLYKSCTQFCDFYNAGTKVCCDETLLKEEKK